MDYIVNGHFSEADTRRLLRKYGKGRAVYIMAGVILHVVRDEKAMVRESASLVRVTKEVAGAYLTKVFDIVDSRDYKTNVSISENCIFIGGH